MENTPIKGIIGPAVSYKYYHWGSDVDCGNVASATAEMNEYDANEWLCFSEIGKHIQKSQRDHVDMGHIPRSIFFGAKKRCEKWAWEGGGVRHGRPESGPGAKTWKSERSARQSKWKTVKATSSSWLNSATPEAIYITVTPSVSVSVSVSTVTHPLDIDTGRHTTTVYMAPSTGVVQT
jgi:hypothetical protein